MTNDPAYDWDCHDAAIRLTNRLYAMTHSCEECPYHRKAPDGKWGWCAQWEDFVDGDMSMTECDFWED